MILSSTLCDGHRKNDNRYVSQCQVLKNEITSEMLTKTLVRIVLLSEFYIKQPEK